MRRRMTGIVVSAPSAPWPLVRNEWYQLRGMMMVVIPTLLVPNTTGEELVLDEAGL